MESLVAALEGDDDRALALLQPVPHDYCPWILARAQAKNNPSQARSTLIHAFAHYRKPVPLDEHFCAFPALYALLEQRATAQSLAVGDSQRIAQLRIVATPEARRLNLLGAVRAQLSGETPEIWRQSHEAKLTQGEPVRIVACKGKYHALGYNAQWVPLYIEDGLSTGEAIELGEQVDCSAEYAGLLYFVNGERGIEVVDACHGAIIANYPRYFHDTACGIAVNDTYIAVCSNLGIEIYRHAPGKDAEFDTLLGAGEKFIPYAWAKDAVLDGDYMYVAAGNAGLVVYRMGETPRPVVVSVMSLDVENPFADRVVKIANRLYLEVHGALWMVDVTDPSHPMSLALYHGPGKSQLALPPMPARDTLLFADKDEPVLWAFDKNTGLPSTCLCALSDGKGGSVSLYYIKDTLLLSERAFLSASKFGLFRFEKTSCPGLSAELFEKVRALDNALYTEVMDAVRRYAGANPDCDIGALLLEFSHQTPKLQLIAPRDLAGIQGYTNKELAQEQWDTVELGLEPAPPDTWPHDRLVAADLKNAKRALLESVMARIAADAGMGRYYKQTLYLLTKTYHAAIDRDALFVYTILRQ